MAFKHLHLIKIAFALHYCFMFLSKRQLIVMLGSPHKVIPLPLHCHEYCGGYINFRGICGLHLTNILNEDIVDQFITIYVYVG